MDTPSPEVPPPASGLGDLPPSLCPVTDAAGFAAATARGRAIAFFAAPWCGPCRLQVPVLARVAGAHAAAITTLVVDVDVLPEVADRLQIATLPAMLAYLDGEIVDSYAGFQLDEYLAELYEWLASQETTPAATPAAPAVTSR